jgi:hypothetical protein
VLSKNPSFDDALRALLPLWIAAFGNDLLEGDLYLYAKMN